VSGSLRGVVVAHGNVATALIGAAEEITGVRGVLTAVSNSGLDRGGLEQRVLEAAGDHPAVIFTDLPSGSCLFAAMRSRPGRDNLRVVTGVNLVMLLEFLLQPEQDLDKVARRAAESGVKGIGSR